MSRLAQPVTFPSSGKTAPTATLKSAMTERLCTYSQDNFDERGKPTPEYLKLYEEWGKGKIGVIVLGNIPIHREGLEAKKNAMAHSSSLTHGGRQVSDDVSKTPVSSSDVQPRPLTVAEIDDLVRRWANGARVLYEAGADGAQLHGAHGYLLSQFLSARVNKRTDDYGGSFENRSRIVFRIVDEIKKTVPKEFIISMKLNSADFADGGMTFEESKLLCQRLDEAGVDLIELSGGTYESGAFEHKKESTKKREGYFHAKLAVTGGFRSKAAMEKALEEHSCDIVGLARPLTAEPYLVKELIEGKKSAAKDNKVDGSMQTATSIAQIGAISTGKPIPDLSDEATAKKVLAAVLGQSEEDKPHKEQETGSYEKSTA
ncbi:SPOSA6832_00481, partial [Sporobolomyces salmonicolor]